MRILITNDDSVNAKQLLPLIKKCSEYGEVTTFVPKIEQSGKSHAIEIHNPFGVSEQTLCDVITVHTVESTPADCLRYAVLGLGLEFDLVISGINRGFNIGSDILYSGTVSAVREAVLLGIPAIAFSTSPEYYDNAVKHLDEIFDFIKQNKLLEIHNLYNINIPAEPKDILITQQGGKYYSDTFKEVDNNLYLAQGKCVYEPSDDLTLDTDAVMSGYISITPLTINITDFEVYNRLKK